MKALTDSEACELIKLAAQVAQECFVPALRVLYKESIQEYQEEITNTRDQLKQLRQDMAVMKERQGVEFKVLKAGVAAVALKQFRKEGLE